MSINDIFIAQQVCKQARAELYRTPATVLHLFKA